MQPTVCAIRPLADDDDPETAVPITNPHFAYLPLDTLLHRVHRTAYRATEFNPGNGGRTRFAPFYDVARTPVPTCYAGATLAAAIHETLFHDTPANARIVTVRLNEVYIRTHSELRTKRDLQIVELRDVTPGKWGILRRELVVSTPALYEQTVLWAVAIHGDIPDADGLVWTSNQCDPDDAYVFFGDRVYESDFTVVRSRNGDTDKSFLTDIWGENRLRRIALTI